MSINFVGGKIAGVIDYGLLDFASFTGSVIHCLDVMQQGTADTKSAAQVQPMLDVSFDKWYRSQMRVVGKEHALPCSGSKLYKKLSSLDSGTQTASGSSGSAMSEAR